MTKTAYTVTATLPDEQTAEEYIQWLNGGHIQAVLAGGAESAMVVRTDEPATPLFVETRYLFPTRDALTRYLQHAAPALRAEGLARFPAERGVRFSREVGTVRGGAGA